MSILMEILPAVGLTIGAITIATIPMLIDSARNNWKKRFRQQVKAGITKGQLTYEDMLHISERWSQDRKGILLSLRIMHADAVSGEDEKLSEALASLRELINEHQKNEPFAELPENISIQLNQLTSIMDNPESNKVSQLAASLSELYASNQNELLKQKRFTRWSFVVGAISLFVGAGSLYLSINGSINA